MAALSPNPLIRHLPVGAAVAVAVIAAGVFALMPADALEQTVWRSGIAALIPAAQPPLGSTARAVLALAFAAVGAAVTWSALFLLVGPGGLLAPKRHRATDIPSEPPSVRRADAHPDAPPHLPHVLPDSTGDVGRWLHPLLARGLPHVWLPNDALSAEEADDLETYL